MSKKQTTFERFIHAACINCVFIVCIISVSLQVTVEGVIGGSVVLPCSSAQHDHELQDIDVYWVYSGSTNVFDIINGKDSVEGQDPRYKNKTETFPDEYEREETSHLNSSIFNKLMQENTPVSSHTHLKMRLWS